eukprot:6178506-Pleurochrysis_carterae.AAC.1
MEIVFADIYRFEAFYLGTLAHVQAVFDGNRAALQPAIFHGIYSVQVALQSQSSKGKDFVGDTAK